MTLIVPVLIEQVGWITLAKGLVGGMGTGLIVKSFELIQPNEFLTVMV